MIYILLNCFFSFQTEVIYFLALLQLCHKSIYKHHFRLNFLKKHIVLFVNLCTEKVLLSNSVLLIIATTYFLPS